MTDIQQDHGIFVEDQSIYSISLRSDKPVSNTIKGLPSWMSLATRAGVPTAMDTLVICRYLTCSCTFMCFANSCQRQLQLPQ